MWYVFLSLLLGQPNPTMPADADVVTVQSTDPSTPTDGGDDTNYGDRGNVRPPIKK
ncbi:hypothetical protein [Sphingobacterium lactis]|uniref:Uncharacterized protein n=1 Tax=Sphingobacterium lactis TaxID=797291 RepID=A0A1H5XXI8_9SPHI|nr:hypothetical protein [Sphingobacterium lactis]SEG16245.1 hypothetical protein SAMN05421877_105151 [Sphingobacterium lactis]